MNTESVELAAYREVLGLLLREDLPEIGLRALMDGCDSPSLRILAGLNRTQLDEARGYFDRALLELSVPRPSQHDAVMHLARDVARAISSGAVAPHEGAEQIFRLTLCVEDHPDASLHTFVYAVSEWDDRPEDRDLFEAGIVAAAGDLLRSSKSSDPEPDLESRRERDGDRSCQPPSK